jgi:hypothetical protein
MQMAGLGAHLVLALYFVCEAPYGLLGCIAPFSGGGLLGPPWLLLLLLLLLLVEQLLVALPPSVVSLPLAELMLPGWH